MIKRQNFETLVKTWDTKTIKHTIKDLKGMIADRKRDRVDHSRFSSDLCILLIELDKRQTWERKTHNFVEAL